MEPQAAILGSSQQRPLEVESFNSFVKNNFKGVFQVVMWTYPASFVMTGKKLLIYSLICVMPHLFCAFIVPPIGRFK